MASDTAQFIIHLVGFSAFLWHGLYILTRGDSGWLARLTGVTVLITATLFGFGALLEALESRDSLQTLVLVDRASWWSAVAPAALWLHISLSLHGDREFAGLRRWIVISAYSAAAVLIVLGTFTNAVRNYASAPYLDVAGPIYLLFVAFLLICTGAASLNILRASLASTDGAVTNTAVRLLAIGSLFFLVGAGSFAIQKLQGNNSDLVAPWLLIFVGLVAMAGAVAIRSNLLLGTDVRRDFLYNATSLAVLLVPFLVISGLLVGFDDAKYRILALALTALITASHTLYDKVREWLDTAFFEPPVREERAAARAYVEALATQPTGPSPALASRKSFDDAVRRAITHLSDPTKLATSPLLNLRIVERGVADQAQDDNRLNRAASLKEVLVDLLAALRPGEGSGGVTSDAYRYYNCLYFPYVRGISRRRAPTVLRQIEERRQRDGTPPSDAERVIRWLLQLDEDTYYKWQRRASDTIAGALREREAAAGGIVPTEALDHVASAGSLAPTEVLDHIAIATT
jgi:hypothetical protein